TRSLRDWSSDVCSSDLCADYGAGASHAGADFETRARHRRADRLPAQRRFDRRVAARSGGVSQADITVLDAAAVTAAIDELSDVLVDCVEGGASVSFMLPFGRADAAKYFEKVVASIARDETVLIGAKLDGRIVGTVQLGLDMPPNQPHRADIKKLLVHRAARNHGIGAALMARAEQEAKARGRTLLVLDTAGAEAGRLYLRTGWQRVGVIPDYAMWPGGGFCDTTYFWKKL